MNEMRWNYLISTNSYKFLEVGEARVFYHKEQSGDCEYCFSITPRHLPYWHHWQSDKSRETIREIQENRADNKVKVKISYSNGDTYILPSVGYQSNDPMDVGRSLVSYLLKKLFYGKATVYFKLKYVIQVNGMYSVYCTTSELAVEHHMDVPNAVKVANDMLFQKILKHLSGEDLFHLGQGQIKLYARRVPKDCNEAAKYVLPLQYRLKREFVKPQTEINVNSVCYTDSYYLRPCERDNNIILAVPYNYYSDTGKRYLILNNNEGDIEDILEITDDRKLFDIDEEPVRCIFCNAVCEESVSLAIHKAFKCGSGFEVFSGKKREMEFDDIGKDQTNNRIINLEDKQKVIHIDKEIGDGTHIWDIFVSRNDGRVIIEGNEKPVDPCENEIQDIKVENEEKLAEVVENQHLDSDEANSADEAKDADEANSADEAKDADEAKNADEAKDADEAKNADEAKDADEKKAADEAKYADEKKAADEAKDADEVKDADEAKDADEKKAADEAKDADEVKDAEENKDECEDAVHVDEKKEIEVESGSGSGSESDEGDFVFL